MKAEKFRGAAGILAALAFAAALCFMVWISVQYKSTAMPLMEHARKLNSVMVQMETGTNSTDLPAKLKNLLPRTPVTLYTEIEAQPQDRLLVKSVFTPMRVYIDGELIYECGQDGSYPVYMNDPPTIVAGVPLPDKDGSLELRIEYLSPTQRSELSLPALYVGSEAALLVKQFYENGFSLLFSLILIMIGTAMVLVSVTFVRGIPGGSSFLWLGLFSLSAGVWVFAECDLVLFLLPYPSLLYAMDYLGLFFVSIPFLRFGIVLLKPKNRLPLTVALYVHYISLAGTLVLQLCGVMDFIRSLYWFQIIAPLAFVVFAADLLWETFRHHNKRTKRFTPAAILIAASTVLELLNYWLCRNNNFTMIFQFGVLAFILSLGIVSGLYVRESLLSEAEKLRLEYEVGAMAHQLAMQREQFERLTRNVETVKFMRHDMRHQLKVIGELCGAGDTIKLGEYVRGMTDNLTGLREEMYCANYAVSAIAAHYLGLAESEDVAVDVRLDIPEDTGNVPAMDLCVILGNFLENAVEACRRMERGNKFVRVRSRIAGDTLSIVVENSFDGLWRVKNGTYLSRKENAEAQDREGVGLSSVRAVCLKHRGLAQNEIIGDVWKSSALVHMEDRSSAEAE